MLTSLIFPLGVKSEGGKLFCTYLISNYYLPRYIFSPLHRTPARCDTPRKNPAIVSSSTGISWFHIWTPVCELFWFSLVGKAVAAPRYIHQLDQVFCKMRPLYDLVDEFFFLTKVKEIAGVNIVLFLRAHIKKYR